MAKEDKKNHPPDPIHGHDPEVEERVRQMLDPTVPDEVPEKPATAPVITGLPMSKDPIKIKIIKDEPEDKPNTDTPTAPVLANAPKPKEPTAPAKVAPKQPEPVQSAEPEPAKPAEDLPSVDEDTETAKAVDDIVAKESDELLAAQDAKRAGTETPKKQAKKRSGWWRSKRLHKLMILLVLISAAVAATVPTSRYFVLNAAGVRASTSVQVVDESTLQPLKNVKVTASGVTATTDKDGNAKLENLRLGPTTLEIEKRAFAPTSYGVTIGWGSNPMGEFKLKPVGTQYTLTLTDYLSGKPIVKAEATSGEASALSDEKGTVLLTMENPPDFMDISVVAEGYRTEQIKLDADIKAAKAVRMVPNRKHVFISKRSGKYDVYKVDLDGKNEQVVLKGTGTERDDMVLIPHPTDEVVALVSTRSGKRADDGSLLNSLTVIDLKSNATEVVDTAERIQVVDWLGDRIIYAQNVADSKDDDPKRHRLLNYNYKDDDRGEIAAANYFNDVMVADGKLYYAPSGAYQNGVNVSLFKVDGDGRNRQIVHDKEALNLFRTSYDHLAVSTQAGWYDYRVGDKLTTKLSGEPANLQSRIYVNSPDNSRSIWVDSRDGKGVLVVRNIKSGEEKVVREQSNLANPVRWLNNNTVVFRLKTDGETADYGLSLDGGNPKKIADVTNIAGVSQWYYY